MTSDKRKFPRIKIVSLYIDIKLRNDSNFTKVEIVDISAGGLSFLSHSLINKSDIIISKFPFHSQTILMNGLVVRINGREIGLKFNHNENDIIFFVDLYNKEINSLFIKPPKKIPKIVYHESEILNDDDLKKMFDI